MNRNEGPDLSFSRLCVQQSTAEHSRAQHSRAQQSTAEHSTAEYRRAEPFTPQEHCIYMCLSACASCSPQPSKKRVCFNCMLFKTQLLKAHRLFVLTVYETTVRSIRRSAADTQPWPIGKGREIVREGERERETERERERSARPFA